MEFAQQHYKDEETLIFKKRYGSMHQIKKVIVQISTISYLMLIGYDIEFFFLFDQK